MNKYNNRKMQSRFLLILTTLACLCGFCNQTHAQEITAEENNNPVILYSATPKKYEIAKPIIAKIIAINVNIKSAKNKPFLFPLQKSYHR